MTKNVGTADRVIRTLIALAVESNVAHLIFK